MTILQSGISQAASDEYQIERSLRFNSPDTAYLSRTPASTSNRKTFTWSGWVKRSSLAGTNYVGLMGSYNGADNYFGLMFTPGDNLTILGDTGAGPTTAYVSSPGVLRDLSAWYHVVMAIDTTQATATDRRKLWINGVLQSLTVSTEISQNLDTQINTSGVLQVVGSYYNGSAGTLFDGYMAEVNFIDGQALTASSFGETSATTGIWMPKKITGMTYGTNGYYLKFSDNSNTTAATLGKDSSGNGNNWTPNNFSVTAGAGNDSLVDSPTNYGTDTGVGGEVRGNYATLNALDTSTALSNGNLDFVTGNGNYGVRSNFEFPASGKWYVECTLSTSTSGSVGEAFGFVNSSASLTSGPSASNKWIIYADSTGSIYANGSTLTSGLGTFASGTVLQVAYDGATGNGWVGKNNTWYNSSGGTTGNPSTGANPTFTSLSNVFAYLHGINATQNFNAGQRPFAYTAPSGFKALCTTNLPTPAIGATSTTLASKNFNTVLYTGNGSTQSITGVNFQPDLVWVKNRTVNANHRIFDSVRGASKVLFPSNTDAEVTDATGLTSFDSNGFSVGANQVNDNTNSFVAWNWRTGSAAVTNTSGTISSQVSASPTAGISVVTYTGNGTSGATVGHGLGVAPAMYIIKRRSSTENWCTYHKALGATKAVFLNLTDAQNTNSVFFNNTEPTSLVFSIGNNTSVNASGSTYVAHCFSEITGFSKFGSYTGNGSTDGAFIYLGFRPAFFIVKLTSSGAENWTMHDSTRDSFNLVNKKLYPSGNFTEAADSNNTCDFLSNGIKLRDAYNGWNASGSTYIYMAFAEAPFNYSRAR